MNRRERTMNSQCAKPRGFTLPSCSSSGFFIGGGAPKTAMSSSHASTQQTVIIGTEIAIQSEKSSSMPYSESADMATRLVVPESGVSAPPSVQAIGTPSSSDLPSGPSCASAMGTIAASASSVTKVTALTNMQPSIRTSKNNFGLVPKALEIELMKRTSSWHCRKIMLMVKEPSTRAVIWFIIAPKQPLAVSWMEWSGNTRSAVAITGTRRPMQ
mmetsp:Transcript_81466/g.209769  ORF Transcript_81466/g.209769 Transcript_81466/m.209769 type:complete len:214 (-) Transcript_81466:813-1454(-)